MTTTFEDIHFLRDVIAVLDHGWTAGTMCNNTGKCLVGAGAAVLGWNYVPDEEQEDFFGDDEGAWDRYRRGAEEKEYQAAKRLFDVLGMADEDFDYRDYDPADYLEEVVDHNDSHNKYSELRPQLILVLEEMEELEARNDD